MRTVSIHPAPRTEDVVPAPGRYRHFKGGEYELLSVAEHTETGERFVVYFSIADPDTVWIRPLVMFTEHVQRPGGVLPRFQPVIPAYQHGKPPRKLNVAQRHLARLVDLLFRAQTRTPRPDR